MASGGDIDPQMFMPPIDIGLGKRFANSMSKNRDIKRANEITEAKKPFIGYKTNIPKVGETKPEIEKRSINLNPDYAADDELRQINSRMQSAEMRKGGKVKKMASGGKVSSASKRADGCAVKGKTKGRMV